MLLKRNLRYVIEPYVFLGYSVTHIPSGDIYNNHQRRVRIGSPVFFVYVSANLELVGDCQYYISVPYSDSITGGVCNQFPSYDFLKICESYCLLDSIKVHFLQMHQWFIQLLLIKYNAPCFCLSLTWTTINISSIWADLVSIYQVLVCLMSLIWFQCQLRLG